MKLDRHLSLYCEERIEGFSVLDHKKVMTTVMSDVCNSKREIRIQECFCKGWSQLSR